jgi:hypothetical protein
LDAKRVMTGKLLMAALMGGMAFGTRAAPRKARKAVPTMVVSPAAEIVAWNAAVDQRKEDRRLRRLQARAA